jgi:hypothetical protein
LCFGNGCGFIERVVAGTQHEQRNKERVKQIASKYLRLDSAEKAEEQYQSAAPHDDDLSSTLTPPGSRR